MSFSPGCCEFKRDYVPFGNKHWVLVMCQMLGKKDERALEPQALPGEWGQTLQPETCSILRDARGCPSLFCVTGAQGRPRPSLWKDSTWEAAPCWVLKVCRVPWKQKGDDQEENRRRVWSSVGSAHKPSGVAQSYVGHRTGWGWGGRWSWGGGSAGQAGPGPLPVTRMGSLLETTGQPALEEGISAAVSRESKGPRRLSWFALIRYYGARRRLPSRLRRANLLWPLITPESALLYSQGPIWSDFSQPSICPSHHVPSPGLGPVLRQDPWCAGPHCRVCRVHMSLYLVPTRVPSPQPRLPLESQHPPVSIPAILWPPHLPWRCLQHNRERRGLWSERVESQTSPTTNCGKSPLVLLSVFPLRAIRHRVQCSAHLG